MYSRYIRICMKKIKMKKLIGHTGARHRHSTQPLPICRSAHAHAATRPTRHSASRPPTPTRQRPGQQATQAHGTGTPRSHAPRTHPHPGNQAFNPSRHRRRGGRSRGRGGPPTGVSLEARRWAQGHRRVARSGQRRRQGRRGAGQQRRRQAAALRQPAGAAGALQAATRKHRSL